MTERIPSIDEVIGALQPVTAPPTLTSPPAGTSLTRRQVGARLDADLLARLKAKSSRTGQSYPAILADAYNAHHADLTPPDPANDPFDYHAPTRLGPGSRLVQFYLTGPQINLLQALAAHTDLSVAGAIRALLGHYLPAPTLG